MLLFPDIYDTAEAVLLHLCLRMDVLTARRRWRRRGGTEREEESLLL